MDFDLEYCVKFSEGHLTARVVYWKQLLLHIENTLVYLCSTAKWVMVMVIAAAVLAVYLV